MDKAILVIDMPDSCDNCPLFHGFYTDMTCDANHYGINYPYPKDFRQDWCPLKPMPKKMEGHDSIYYQWGDYEDGWNHCIDCVSGE